MNSYICIQARLSSVRLPKKVLSKVNKKPLLMYLIDNLVKTNLKKNIYVLTSNNESDGQLIKYCKDQGIKYFCGSLENVFDRFHKFFKEYNADSVVRISADSPMIDPILINRMLDFSYSNRKYDLITNIHPRTFPSGQSVEIINKKAFRKIPLNKLSKSNQEHVTSYFYENPKSFSIYNFDCTYKHSFEKLSIDVIKDMKNFRRFIQHTKDKPLSNIEEIIKVWKDLFAKN